MEVRVLRFACIKNLFTNAKLIFVLAKNKNKLDDFDQQVSGSFGEL